MQLWSNVKKRQVNEDWRLINAFVLWRRFIDDSEKEETVRLFAWLGFGIPDNET